MLSRLIAGSAFAALWQVAGHYSPLAKPWERPGVHGRIGAYIYGTTGILLGLGIAAGSRTLARSFVIAAAAGAATVAVYTADHLATAPARELVRHGFES